MSPEQVAEAWALWVSGDICDDLEERDIIPVGYLEDVRSVIIEHLTDVAISNAMTAAQAPGVDTKKGDAE